MKTKILSLLAVIAFALGATSCHDDIKPNNGKETTQGEGTVSLISLGIEINNAEKVVANSRSVVDLSDYIINIKDSDGATVKTWSYANMPELFTLPVGDYTVTVRSHNVLKAEWEHPYFYGEKTFSITNDKITEIGVVTCKLANIKVTVDYSDELRAVMGNDCKVVVRCNDEGVLEYSSDETRAGYFAATSGSTTLIAEFTGTVEGNYEHLTYTATDVEAGQHRKITFKLKTHNSTVPDEEGSISINGGINVDVSTQNVSLTANVRIEEDVLSDDDRPGSQKTDPDPGTEPGVGNDDITLYCATASFDEPNPITGDDVVVEITAVNGIANLIVSISSTNEDFLLSLSDLDVPTTFDLAHPGDKADIYKNSLGLPVGDEVIGATHLNFDISSFVPLLLAFPGTHKFQLSVTDAKQQQLVKTLTFVAE